MGCLHSSTEESEEELTPFQETYKLYVAEFKALRIKEKDVEKLYNIFIALDTQKLVSL